MCSGISEAHDPTDHVLYNTILKRFIRIAIHNKHQMETKLGSRWLMKVQRYLVILVIYV